MNSARSSRTVEGADGHPLSRTYSLSTGKLRSNSSSRSTPKRPPSAKAPLATLEHREAPGVFSSGSSYHPALAEVHRQQRAKDPLAEVLAPFPKQRSKQQLGTLLSDLALDLLPVSDFLHKLDEMPAHDRTEAVRELAVQYKHLVKETLVSKQRMARDAKMQGTSSKTLVRRTSDSINGRTGAESPPTNKMNDTSPDAIEEMVLTMPHRLKCERCFVFSLDTQACQMEVKCLDGGRVKVKQLLLEECFAVSCARDGHVLFVDSAKESPLNNTTLDEDLNITLRSVLCVPIADITGVVQGVVQACNKLGADDAVFQDEDARILIHQAAQVQQTWLIQDAPQVQRLIRRFKTREQQRRYITKAARQLSNDLTLSGVITAVNKCVKNMMQADLASLFIVDEENQQLVSYKFDGSESLRVPLNRGLAAHCATSGEVLIIDDAYDSDKFNPEVDNATGYRTKTILCVPVHDSEGKTMAVLQAINKNMHATLFDEEDSDLMRDFSVHVHSGLRAAVMLEERDAQLESANRSHRVNKAMLKLATTVWASLELKTLMLSIMQEAKEALECDHASLFLVDWKRKQLVCYNFKTREGAEEVVISMTGGLAAHCAKTGELLNIHDAYESPHFNKMVDKVTGYRTKSVLCCPCTNTDGGVIAVLQTINKLTDEAFSEDDTRMLQDFSKHAQMALANALLFRDTKVSLQQATRLHEINRTLAQIASHVSAELRVDRVATALTQHARKLLSCEHCVLLVVDQAKSDFLLYGTHRQTRRGIERVHISRSRGIASRCLHTGQVELLNEDPPSDPAFYTATDGITGGNDCLHLLCVPVKSASVKEKDEYGELMDRKAAAVMVAINKVHEQKGGAQPVHASRGFTDEDVELTKQLCVHAQIALRNAALFEQNKLTLKQAQRSQQVTQTLLAMARTLSSELDLRSVVKQIMFQAKMLLDCQRCSLFICDRDSNELVCYNFNETQTMRITMDKGLAAQCAKTGELMYVPDAYQNANFDKREDEVAGSNTCAVVCLPVQDSSGEVLAVIQAMSKVDQSFSGEDMELLKDFVTHAEIALQNASLFEERTKALQALESSEALKTALLQMVKTLSSELDLKKCVREIMKQCKVLLQVDICTMFLIDEEANEMITYNFTTNEGGEGKDVVRIPLDKGVAAHCAKSAEVINLVDAYDSPLFNDAMDKKTGYRTRGMMCMPVFYGQGRYKVAAVLQTINKLDGSAFNDEDISILHDFCAHAQIALRNARRYERVSSRYQIAMSQGGAVPIENGKIAEESDDDEEYDNVDLQEVGRLEAAALTIVLANDHRKRALRADKKDSNSVSFAQMPVDDEEAQLVAEEQADLLHQLHQSEELHAPHGIESMGSWTASQLGEPVRSLSHQGSFQGLLAGKQASKQASHLSMQELAPDFNAEALLQSAAQLQAQEEGNA